MRYATWFTMFCTAGLACGLAACGDDSTETTAATTSGTTTTTSSGTGGAGGAAPTLLNGCDPATAEDHTADATFAITSVGTTYSPACIKVAAGTAITINSNFTIHPLVAGEIVNGASIPDTSSPIPATDMGMTVTFTLATAGDYPYYCNMHAPAMAGAIFVE